MTKTKEDETREERIHMEIVVDCYDEEERAMGWYCYLDEMLTFPFEAVCREKRAISPLIKGEKVTVLEMAPEDDCMEEMYVIIEWNERTMGVPLAQLSSPGGNEETVQAIEDWQYWRDMGYQF